MDSLISELNGSLTQQTLLPTDISEPCVTNLIFHQIFPIANIKRGISADQELLIPINVREWFKANDFIYILAAIMGFLDLSKFFAKYRSDGLGASFYHPQNMLGIILYSISRGEYSSRKIERNCITDIGIVFSFVQITLYVSDDAINYYDKVVQIIFKTL